MNKAWSQFEVKSIDDESRTFEGIASTPGVDLGGDSLDPMGAEFTLPIAMLWQHGKGTIKDPVGWITHAVPSKDGIFVRGQMVKPKADYPQPLRDEYDGAWVKVRDKIVRGLSVGWLPKEWEPMKNGRATRYTKWSWHELSPVGIAMNTEASITAIKSADELQLRAASGADGARFERPPPGATGTQTKPAQAGFFSTRAKGTTMTAAEHIASLEAKRAANCARMKAIEDDASGATMDQAQGEEFDSLMAEVKTIDSDLIRRRQSQALMIEKAVPVKPPEPGADAAIVASQQRQGVVTGMGKSSVAKGIQFTRVALCLLRAKGDTFQALENAKMYKDTPDVEQAVKAAMYAKTAVAVGNTTDSAWAAPLVVYQNLASEFIDLLRPMTILGKLTGVRNVPFNISIPRTTAGTTSSWVGEDNPKPVSRMSFETITLGHTKIATIVVISEELVQDSNPAAEGLIQADMLASIAAYSDAQFIDPTVTASGTVRPASITNGLTEHSMTGTAVANVLTDVQTLMSGFITANLSFSGAVWVMHPRTALYLSMLLSPLGTVQFPGINVNGGTFMGFPVITSASVPIDTGNDTYIVLLSAPDILLAESGMMVDVSREASLQIDDNPSDSAASLISLWQKNLVGLRAERRICYRRRREAAVQVLSDVSY